MEFIERKNRIGRMSGQAIFESDYDHFFDALQEAIPSLSDSDEFYEMDENQLVAYALALPTPTRNAVIMDCYTALVAEWEADRGLDYLQEDYPPEPLDMTLIGW